MFENLTDKLERSFKDSLKARRITEINVARRRSKEIRRALMIDADVNYKVAKTFTRRSEAESPGPGRAQSVKRDR